MGTPQDWDDGGVDFGDDIPTRRSGFGFVYDRIIDDQDMLLDLLLTPASPGTYEGGWSQMEYDMVKRHQVDFHRLCVDIIGEEYEQGTQAL